MTDQKSSELGRSGAYNAPAFRRSGAYSTPSGAFASPSNEWAPVSATPPVIHPPAKNTAVSGVSSVISSAVSSVVSSGDHSAVLPALPNGANGSLVMRFGNLEETEISQRYDVGEQVGRGASAIVYEAWRKTDQLHVVIKVLQITASEDEDEAHIAIKRFYREAELISKLHEEHIVQCVDYGKFQGTPCMVLEYVDGLSLDKFLAQYGALPIPYATGIIEQLLLALEETHKMGIIHRDIKPGNMMVFDSPPPYTIRVLDFGISSVLDGFQSKTLMTQTGNVRGTPSYMAPELFTGETRASIESDLYAVGLVYLECLTGEVAVSDKSFMRVAYKQVNEPLEIPGYIPQCLADIILKLAAKPVHERYHSATDALADIRAALPTALEEEEKCLEEWKKSNSQLTRTSKIVPAINVDNQAGNSKRNWIIAALIAVAAVVITVVALVVVDKSDSEDSTYVANELVPAPNDDDAANSEAQIQLLNQKILSANIAVASSKINDKWSQQVDAINKKIDDDKNAALEAEKAKLAEQKAKNKNKTTTKKGKTNDPFSIDLNIVK